MIRENSFVSTVLSYSKSQRIGVILFFIIILATQGFYYCWDFNTIPETTVSQSAWLANQNAIDRLKLELKNHKHVIHPFNPNFITDFKGYKLGMSVNEIDRLLAYRKKDRFVNSAAEFQAVTQVSDSLLAVISPYFKFPDWVKDKKANERSFQSNAVLKEEKIVVLDINAATKADLMKVYGIGDKISERILEQKQKLGAFVSMEQMHDIWGLSPEVITKLQASFAIKSVPDNKKININNASVKELSQFPFFRYSLAREIVVYRTMNGDLTLEDLTKIKGFPVDKIKIIALYLEL